MPNHAKLDKLARQQPSHVIGERCLFQLRRLSSRRERRHSKKAKIDMSSHSYSNRLPQSVEAFVSIGKACRSRHQIDKFMRRIQQRYTPESYYFDWLMKGGVEGVTKVISRGFEISPSHIEIHEQGNRFIPKDRISGHLFLHDFGTGWWESDREAALIKVKNNMKTTIKKYQYLGKKTDFLLGSKKPVALVYHGVSTDDDWLNLRRTLRGRYKKNIPIINVIELDQQPTSVDGIYTTFIDDAHSPKNGTPQEWEGWDESWYSALASLGCINPVPESLLKSLFLRARDRFTV